VLNARNPRKSTEVFLFSRKFLAQILEENTWTGASGIRKIAGRASVREKAPPVPFAKSVLIPFLPLFDRNITAFG